MPIEFRCTQCGKLLRTQDGTAGKKAKCPQCGCVLPIPEASVEAGAPQVEHGSESPPPPAAAANPYQSPTAQSYVPPTVDEGPRHFQPTRIEIGEIINWTWEIFKKQWASCLGAFWGAVGAFLLVALPVLVVFHLADRNPGPEAILVAAPFYAAGWWLFLGLNTAMLRIARGKTVDLQDFLSVGPIWLPSLAATLIVAAASSAGYIFCIIPGIIVTLMFSQFMFLIVDRRAGIVESLQLSMEATKGNKLSLFLLWLLTGIVGSLFMTLTCGLGMIVVQPFQLLLGSVTYLAMTGQISTTEAYPTKERQFGQP